MRFYIKQGMVACLMSVALVGLGCASSTQSRPGVSETDGTYQMYAGFDQGTTWNAASAAALDLGYVVVKRDRPANGSWTLQARDAGANLITIQVDSGTLEASRVTVRIDPGQNGSMSQLVLNAVRDRLPSETN